MRDDREFTAGEIIVTILLCIIIIAIVWLWMETRYEECMEQKHDEIFCKLYMRN